MLQRAASPQHDLNSCNLLQQPAALLLHPAGTQCSCSRLLQARAKDSGRGGDVRGDTYSHLSRLEGLSRNTGERAQTNQLNFPFPAAAKALHAKQSLHSSTAAQQQTKQQRRQSNTGDRQAEETETKTQTNTRKGRSEKL